MQLSQAVATIEQNLELNEMSDVELSQAVEQLENQRFRSPMTEEKMFDIVRKR